MTPLSVDPATDYPGFFYIPPGNCGGIRRTEWVRTSDKRNKPHDFNS